MKKKTHKKKEHNLVASLLGIEAERLCSPSQHILAVTHLRRTAGYGLNSLDSPRFPEESNIT